MCGVNIDVCMSVCVWVALEYETEESDEMIWYDRKELVVRFVAVSVSWRIYWGKNGDVLVWCDVVRVDSVDVDVDVDVAMLLGWWMKTEGERGGRPSDDEKCGWWCWLMLFQILIWIESNCNYCTGMGWILNRIQDYEKKSNTPAFYNSNYHPHHITSHHTCTYYGSCRECFEYRRRRLTTIR